MTRPSFPRPVEVGDRSRGGTAATAAGACAGNDTAIRTLAAGETIDLSDVGTRSLSLRANTSGTIGSIRFGFDGNANQRTENYAPYTIAGKGANNDMLAFAGMTKGTHTVRVTAYSGANASGSVLGSTFSLNFTIVD